MTQATATPTPSQCKEPVSRLVRLVKPFDVDGKNAEMIVTITRGNRKPESFEYWIDRMDSDFGEAFLVEKVGDGSQPNEEYHVLLDGQDSSCTCPGFVFAKGKDGRRCKHLDGLTVLKSRNLL